jgi:hypothetical protein
MKRDEVLELLSKTQDNNALLNRSGRFTDLLSEATIEVCRTGYGFAQISVIARTIEEAEELALEEAGNYEFREKDADYKIV